VSAPLSAEAAATPRPCPSPLSPCTSSAPQADGCSLPYRCPSRGSHFSGWHQ